MRLFSCRYTRKSTRGSWNSDSSSRGFNQSIADKIIIGVFVIIRIVIGEFKLLSFLLFKSGVWTKKYMNIWFPTTKKTEDKMVRCLWECERIADGREELKFKNHLQQPLLHSSASVQLVRL